MFGIGFTELLLIGVVALIVVGPERLPRVARIVGAWVGRFNRYAAQVKADIDREMQMDELRGIQKSVKESVQKYEIVADETGQQIKQEAAEMKKAVQDATSGAVSEAEGHAAKVPDVPASEPRPPDA